MKSLWRNSHSGSKPRCDQGSNHTRHQCRIIHNSYAYNFQRKHSRRHRSSKQCRECRTHTAHNDHMPILFIQMNPSSKLIRNTSAKLNRRSLTSCRTSGQMRKSRRNKNQRCRQKRHIILRPYRRKYLIRTSIILTKLLIQKYNNQSHHRQQIKRPSIFLPVTGHSF